MDNKIFLQELVDGLASRKGIAKKDADAFVRSVFDVVEDYLKKDGVVKIKGFGTFKLVEVSSRESVNVNTGERIRIDGHAKVSFTPDSMLRDHINRPFAEFATIIINEGTDLKEMERLDMPMTPLKETEQDEVLPEVTVEEISMAETEHPLEENVVEKIAQDEDLSTEATADKVSDEETEENVTVEEMELSDTATPTQMEEPSVESAQVVGTQHIDLLTVTTQHVENQTIHQITQTTSDNEQKKNGIFLSWCGVTFVAILVAFLMVASFFIGNALPKVLNISSQEGQMQEFVKTEDVKPDVTTTTSTPKVSETKSVEKKNGELDEAAKYDQLTNGEYLIVGTLEEHTMAVGDNLYKIAKNAYGDKELARYIIFYNKISNPDVVHLGKVLKLPKLIKKE